MTLDIAAGYALGGLIIFGSLIYLLLEKASKSMHRPTKTKCCPLCGRCLECGRLHP